MMGIVYCGTPLLIGYGAYHWSMGKAEKNLGSGGDKLRERLTYADKNRIREANRERLEMIRQLGVGSKGEGSSGKDSRGKESRGKDSRGGEGGFLKGF